MRRRILFTAATCMFGILALFAGSGWATLTSSGGEYVNMKWSFKSTHPYIVYLKLYGQNSKVVWPSPSTHWTLDDSDAHAFSIRCREGEKICYGAWADGKTYWGVGRDDKYGCETCCVVCARGDRGTRTLR